MAKHNHADRDIKPEGECPGCDGHRDTIRSYEGIVIGPAPEPEWDE